jgi:signal transduction histidine kinase
VEISFDSQAEPGGRADQQERLLSCFQTALGHELPNKLLGLQGYAAELVTSLKGHPDLSLREMAGQLADLADRLHSQVHALAELGRLLREPGLAETVPLEEAGQEAAAEVNILFRDRPIEYHFQKSLPTLTLPRRTLHVLLVQLLRNGVEAGVSGRTLRLEVGSRPCAEGVEVWITDNGRGMSEAEGQKLFEPFASRHSDQYGLGLFLVRQLMAGWGGTIRIQSRPGEGTTVTLLFRQ